MTHKVVVIGNCTLDISFRLSRFPRPGETLLSDQRVRDVGGKGANQAVAAARAGVMVAFCSAVGDDADGAWIRSHLEREGVEVARVLAVDMATDVSIIYVTDDGHNCIVSTHSAAQALGESDVQAALVGVSESDVVLMQGNLDLPLTEYALREARRRGAWTILNPAPIHYDYAGLWPYVSIAIPNEVELEALTGTGDIEAGARRLIALGAGEVITTLGAAGALHVSAGRTDAYPVDPVEATDTTGAGDVFCGTLAAALAGRQPLDVAIRLGVGAATLSVSRHGTQAAFPSRQEVEALMGDLRARGQEDTQ